MHARVQTLFRRLESVLFSQRKVNRDKRLQFVSRITLEKLEDRRLLATLYVDEPGDYTPSGPSNGDTVTWNPGVGSQHGGPVANLTFGTNAFGTIQDAVTAATAGDTIRVAPGIFPEAVNVNKQLFVLGNQVGVDQQTKTGVRTPAQLAAETEVTGNNNEGRTPFHVTASDVEINGFTVTGATNANQFGFGILLGAGTSGSEVRNNIVENNIVGLGLANASTTNQTIIERNLFQHNNATGPANGTAIYTDQSVAGGTLNNVLIDFNKFIGNTTAAVNIVSTVATFQPSNITISRNIIDSNGTGIQLANTLNSTITQNELFNSTDAQIVLAGGNNNISITENCIESFLSPPGDAPGILINNDVAGTANQNVTINSNILDGNGGAGLEIESGAYVSTSLTPLNAEFNYWGSPTGPTHPSNPGGTGEEIVDPLNQVDFVPFLTIIVDTDPNVRGCQPGTADVSITKTDAPEPVSPGGTLTYTITVANSGPSATDATVIDMFPSQLSNITFTSVAAGGASGNETSGSGNISDTINLPRGGSVVYTVTATVSQSASGSISNTARVEAASPTVDTNADNNSATATTNVAGTTAVTDLSVTKTDSPDPVTAGQNLTYTITVVNNGPSAAQNVRLTDVLPANTTLVSSSVPAGWSAFAQGPAGTITSTRASLPAASGAQTFTVVVRTSSSAAAGSTLMNTATVSTDTADTNPINDSDTENTAVQTAANLAVTKTDSPDPVAPGGTVFYTIRIVNNGPSDAQDVVLTDVIAGATITNVTRTDGPTPPVTTTPSGFTLNVGDLALNEDAVFVVTASVPDSAPDNSTITNTATVTSPTDNTPDSDTETTTVRDQVVPPGLPVCEVFTSNAPGNPGTATLGIDLDDPSGNVVVVTGTSGRDIIIVEPQPRNSSRIRVVHNGRVIGNFSRADVQHIVVFGRGGNDKIVINGSLSIPATLFGEDGNDEIFGGRANDGIDGGGGNDRLFGGSGNDTICGGFGFDTIFGQGGNDLLGGEGGNDRIFGEAGADVLLGGDGADSLFGGSGNDFVFGQAGNDQLFGDTGHDVVVGGDGNDRLFGDGGRDLLIGGTGADQLFGESDEDILVAGTTAHDENLEALEAIMAEWRSSNRYIVRVNNIRNGGGANGGFTLDDTTVVNDSSSDILWGHSALDWFLFGPGDRARDRGRNEQIN